MQAQWNDLRNYVREQISNANRPLDIAMHITYLDILRRMNDIENKQAEESLREAGY